MSVTRFSTKDACEVVAPTLEREGYVIIENVLKGDEIETLRAELAPHIRRPRSG